MDQISVASDPKNGPLIAALTERGEAMVKEGSLPAKWNDEFNGAQQIAVASDAVNGPLIGIVNSDAQLMVKERSLTANWNKEHNDVLIVCLAGYCAAGRLFRWSSLEAGAVRLIRPVR